jgi:hypothetical protein
MNGGGDYHWRAWGRGFERGVWGWFGGVLWDQDAVAD